MAHISMIQFSLTLDNFDNAKFMPTIPAGLVPLPVDDFMVHLETWLNALSSSCWRTAPPISLRCSEGVLFLEGCGGTSRDCAVPANDRKIGRPNEILYS